MSLNVVPACFASHEEMCSWRDALLCFCGALCPCMSVRAGGVCWSRYGALDSVLSGVTSVSLDVQSVRSTSSRCHEARIFSCPCLRRRCPGIPSRFVVVASSSPWWLRTPCVCVGGARINFAPGNRQGRRNENPGWLEEND